MSNGRRFSSSVESAALAGSSWPSREHGQHGRSVSAFQAPQSQSSGPAVVAHGLVGENPAAVAGLETVSTTGDSFAFTIPSGLRWKHDQTGRTAAYRAHIGREPGGRPAAAESRASPTPTPYTQSTRVGTVPASIAFVQRRRRPARVSRCQSNSRIPRATTQGRHSDLWSAAGSLMCS